MSLEKVFTREGGCWLSGGMGLRCCGSSGTPAWAIGWGRACTVPCVADVAAPGVSRSGVANPSRAAGKAEQIN